MNREVHVRFCEGVGVKFPRAPRPLIHTFALASMILHVGMGQKRQECRLKYVMFTQSRRPARLFAAADINE